MGFELQYQLIDGKPTLPEVLCETADEVISLLISSRTGNKLQAVDYDTNDIKAALNNIPCELNSGNVKAMIPIKTGDFVVLTRRSKPDNYLDVLCFYVWFIDGFGASGASGCIEYENISGMYDGFIRYCLKKPNGNLSDAKDECHESDFENPLVLLSIFNVINPRNAVSYHLAP